MTKISKQNTCNAGEYYIAARLSACNFITTITLGRAEKYDVLALSPKGETIKLSVKTALKEKTIDFPLSDKNEEGGSKDFYYAFIRLNEFQKEPEFWIIPSTIVSPIIKKAHKKWLATPGKKSQQHKDTSMRILPIIVRKGIKEFYPQKWENDVKKYYMNLNQIILR